MTHRLTCRQEFLCQTGGKGRASYRDMAIEKATGRSVELIMQRGDRWIWIDRSAPQQKGIEVGRSTGRARRPPQGRTSIDPSIDSLSSRFLFVLLWPAVVAREYTYGEYVHSTWYGRSWMSPAIMSDRSPVPSHPSDRNQIGSD
jgi:hypothetical protein